MTFKGQFVPVQHKAATEKIEYKGRNSVPEQAGFCCIPSMLHVVNNKNKTQQSHLLIENVIKIVNCVSI